MRAELVSTNRRLQSEMQQRVREVEERRRLEQQLQVRRRLETVGTLAGGVAHEINNMLVPIQLYTELALDDADLAAPIRADLTRVLESARRAKRVVSDILVFTHQPVDKVLQSIDLAGVVREVVELYRRIAPAGVRIVEDIEEGSLHVQGDAAMLNQIATNLISNAIQAMGENGGELAVSLGRATAEEAAAAGQPARGLRGLARARHRARHGRTHAAEDLRTVLHDPTGGPGYRTRTFGRPRHGPEPGRRGDRGKCPRCRRRISCIFTACRLNRRAGVCVMARILIIDDESDVRAVMAKVLERAGHQVEVAENGAAGMSAYEANGADLIITDVIMPGQNGVDLVKQLRNARFGGRIIAISGGGNLASAGYAPGAITTTAYLRPRPRVARTPC